MKKIIVAGLGPGSIEYLPVKTLELMRNTASIYLRTEKHPLVEELLRRGISFESFDSLYDRGCSFQEVYENIVSILLEQAAEGDVLYGVPGHPMVAERTVQMLLEAAQGAYDVQILPAMSCLDAVYASLRLDPTRGLLIMDALELLENSSPLNTQLPLMCTQVYGKRIASEVKLTLMEHYPDAHPVVVVHAAVVPGQELIKTIPLFELDRQEEISYLTTLFVPETDSSSSRQEDPFRFLEKLMIRLRSPGGCPWDLEQDFDSLKRYLIEETYEVIEAIEDADMHKLQEELGDLLLQVIFYSQIAREKDIFNINDVIGGISEKLIRRHPHVFGNSVKVNCVEDVNVNWEKIKHSEKMDRPRFDIPRELPALMRAEKVQKKAAETGFDWPDISGAWEKIQEELAELSLAIQEQSHREVKGEVGDLLFAVVNVARFLQADPEEALTLTINKFIHRFKHIETRAEELGKRTEEMSLEEMDELWNEAKDFHSKKK